MSVVAPLENGIHCTTKLNIVIKNEDFSDLNTVSNILQLINEISINENTIGSVDDWLQDFLEWKWKHNNNNTNDKQQEFYHELQTYLLSGNGSKWTDDIIFNDINNIKYITRIKHAFINGNTSDSLTITCRTINPHHPPFHITSNSTDTTIDTPFSNDQNTPIQIAPNIYDSDNDSIPNNHYQSPYNHIQHGLVYKPNGTNQQHYKQHTNNNQTDSIHQHIQNDIDNDIEILYNDDNNSSNQNRTSNSYCFDSSDYNITNKNFDEYKMNIYTLKFHDIEFEKQFCQYIMNMFNEYNLISMIFMCFGCFILSVINNSFTNSIMSLIFMIFMLFCMLVLVITQSTSLLSYFSIKYKCIKCLLNIFDNNSYILSVWCLLFLICLQYVIAGNLTTDRFIIYYCIILLICQSIGFVTFKSYLFTIFSLWFTLNVFASFRYFNLLTYGKINDEYKNRIEDAVGHRIQFLGNIPLFEILLFNFILILIHFFVGYTLYFKEKNFRFFYLESILFENSIQNRKFALNFGSNSKLSNSIMKPQYYKRNSNASDSINDRTDIIKQITLMKNNNINIDNNNTPSTKEFEVGDIDQMASITSSNNYNKNDQDIPISTVYYRCKDYFKFLVDDVQLSEYYDLLVKNGYDNIFYLYDITRNDLKDIGIKL